MSTKYVTTTRNPCIIYRLKHDLFHIRLVIVPRPPYQPKAEPRADMGRGTITRLIWKVSCFNLFITYLQQMERYVTKDTRDVSDMSNKPGSLTTSIIALATSIISWAGYYGSFTCTWGVNAYAKSDVLFPSM